MGEEDAPADVIDSGYDASADAFADGAGDALSDPVNDLRDEIPDGGGMPGCPAHLAATSAADRGDLAGYDSAVSSSDANQTISLVGYVGGAVGIVAGCVLLWLGSANEAATVVAPAVTPDFAGAVWYGRL